MTSTPTQTYLQLSENLLEITFPLAKGPNKYKSLFGKILEGVFRKDYFTLQTVTLLGVKAEEEPGLKIVFGGCILDLSRRVFEDMVYMEYIKEKGKNKYSHRFSQFMAVEQKNDVEFLLASGISVDKKIIALANEEYRKVSKDIRSRKNWAGQDIEKIIEWLLSKNLIGTPDKETLLKIYQAGNRKNHTSPRDILAYSDQKVLERASEMDTRLGLIVIVGAVVKVALRFAEETEVSKEIANAIEQIWNKIISL